MLLAIVPSAIFAGCASDSPDVFVPASEYAAAFTAARDVLHSYRFTLDRVDVRSGVLTTHAKPSSGYFTPWDTEQSTPAQDWEDTIHQQQRRVQIIFSPAASPDVRETDLDRDQARDAENDLLEHPMNTNAHVLVIVERVVQAGRRPNTKSVFLATYTEDTLLGFPSRFEVAISDDPPLAARIAKEIKSRTAKVLSDEKKMTEASAGENPPATREAPDP